PCRFEPVVATPRRDLFVQWSELLHDRGIERRIFREPAFRVNGVDGAVFAQVPEPERQDVFVRHCRLLPRHLTYAWGSGGITRGAQRRSLLPRGARYGDRDPQSANLGAFAAAR